MKVATSIGLVLLASGTLIGPTPAAEDTGSAPAARGVVRPLRFDGVDSMQFGEGRACAYILVVDSSGRGIPSASVSEVAKRRGGITDLLGRCVLCGLANEMTLALKINAHGYVSCRDTARIEHGRPDTLVVRLEPDPSRVPRPRRPR